MARKTRTTAPADDRSPEEKLFDAVETAKATFTRRAAELGDPGWGGIAADAWANAFAVEVHAEYADDLERWTVALSTLEMLADI